MGRKYGNDYHLWVENATPAPTTASRARARCSVNRNGRRSTSRRRRTSPTPRRASGHARSLTISIEIMVDLPDANGYTRLETLANATSPTPFNVQVRKGGVAGTGSDVVFQGSVYITDFNTDDSGQNGV
jgi:hypothetical protein